MIKSRDEEGEIYLILATNYIWGFGGEYVLNKEGNIIAKGYMNKKNNNYIFNSIDLSNVSKELTVINNTWSNKIYKTIKKRKPRTITKRKNIRSYKSYMKSNQWIQRKNQYWRNHKRMCEACNSKTFIILHHMYYSGLYGNEPDTELVALCNHCHHLFHKNYKLQKDMIEDTKSFIYEIQSNKSLFKEIEDLDNSISMI